MLLLLADGMTITDIAAAVGISRRFVYKWVQRFVQEGLEGLQDKSRRNRRIEPRLPDPADQNDADIVSRHFFQSLDLQIPHDSKKPPPTVGQIPLYLRRL